MGSFPIDITFHFVAKEVNCFQDRNKIKAKNLVLDRPNVLFIERYVQFADARRESADATLDVGHPRGRRIGWVIGEMNSFQVNMAGTLFSNSRTWFASFRMSVQTTALVTWFGVFTSLQSIRTYPRKFSSGCVLSRSRVMTMSVLTENMSGSEGFKECTDHWEVNIAHLTRVFFDAICGLLPTFVLVRS
jgi:hypothetical protein